MKARQRLQSMKAVATLLRQNKPVSEISQELNIQPRTIYRWINNLEKAGVKLPRERFEDDPNLPEFLKRDNFIKLDCIEKLKRECRTDRLPFDEYLNPILKVCQYVKKHPDEFLKSFQDAEDIFLDFETAWEKTHPNQMVERHRKAMRKLLSVNGVTIKQKARVLHGSTESRGDYSDLHLSDAEFEDGLDIVERLGGFEYKAIFAINHEIFPRPETLSKWIPKVDTKYAEVNGKSIEYGACEVYEAKQEKRYKKMILDPRTIKWARELPQNKPITDLPFSKFQTEYCSILRKFYKEIGKIDDQKYQKGTEGYYWSNRPIYSMRHSAAVKWLRRTAFNASLVANMGWEDSKTLTQYYASTTVEQIMEAGQCWFCRPPNELKGDSIFCSATHALAYLNGERMN